MRLHWLAATSLLIACSSACSSSGKGPALSPSSNHSSYALGYASELAASNKAVAEAQAREKAAASAFGGRIDELKKPDWDKVQTIVSDSDQAGKSAGFAEGHGEIDTVRAFWDDEKDTVTSRTIGNAQHTLKEANCAAEVAGPIAFSINDAMTRQMQKKLRAHNEAFLTIERYKTSLGPQNTATLEKLADEISQASYDVHVVMVVERERMQRMVAEKDDVKKTLDRLIKEEAVYEAEPGRTEAEKKASRDRVTAANKTKAEIDASAAEAKTTASRMDSVIGAAQKDYDAALERVRAKIAERKKAEAAPQRSSRLSRRSRS